MDIARRFNDNPLIGPLDVKPSTEGMIIECLLNPGVFRFRDKIWLLCRVAERTRQDEHTIKVPVFNEKAQIEILTFDKKDPDLDASDPRVISWKGKNYLTTLSHLRLLSSDDGKRFYEDDTYSPIMGEGMDESFGIEDCRVTQMDDGFHLTYTKVSEIAVAVGYMFTLDWKNFERRGMIFPPHNKDCAIFERKINGKFYALHRPSSPELGGNYIWLAESPDLMHWGNHKCIATTRKGMWDSSRVGAGAAPIETSEGWLEIYHGADANHRYCLGALLLDINDPSRVIARSFQPIMEPVLDYEQTGFFGNVVFTNGHLVKGDKITMYYGASDEVICGAEFYISEILDSLKMKETAIADRPNRGEKPL
jgi:beta-1,2-mannobiose phosphorylase / 1,2-beta-oligomannan phosphorylase